MNSVTVPGFLEPEEIPLCLTEVHRLETDGLLQRYDNPFEAKWFLADKTNLPTHLAAAFGWLRNGTTQWWISHLLGVPITTVDFNHYGGLFIYQPGDYLKAHVDAGVHPRFSNFRKVATALLYLTVAELETYSGDTCLKDDPLVWSRNYHLYKPGDLVVFNNTDTAWHGVPTCRDRRVVLTVSYLADSFDHAHYQNPRTRAYFCKTLWDKETPELTELRKLRVEAPEQVYRTGR